MAPARLVASPEFRGRVRQLRLLPTGAEKPAVSGVGDDAYYKYFAEPRYEKIKVVDLDVKKGNTAFGIEVGGFPIDEAKAKAKTLALEVLARM